MNANHMTIGFIGLGLIGGSIAKTIRRIHPDSIIYGFDTNTDSLKAAKEDGTLNQYFETLDSTFSSCDIIFLCAPVSNNIEYLKEYKYPKFLNSYGYKISYIPYENQNETIILQENQMISGNNVDGFILSERVSDE